MYPWRIIEERQVRYVIDTIYLYYLWVCGIILSLLRSLSIIVCNVTRVLEPMLSLGWLLYLCLKAVF